MRPQAWIPLAVAICSARGLRVSTPPVTLWVQGGGNCSATNSTWSVMAAPGAGLGPV
ncbi:hypothetical protein D3C80_1059730 [compost metagenome]